MDKPSPSNRLTGPERAEMKDRTMLLNILKLSALTGLIALGALFSDHGTGPAPMTDQAVAVQQPISTDAS